MSTCTPVRRHTSSGREQSMKTIATSLFLTLVLLSPAYAAAQIETGDRQHTQTTQKAANETQSPEELFKTATALLDKGRIDEAQTILKSLADAHPDQPSVHYALALSYYRQEKYKSASEALARVLHLRPDAKGVYLLKASLDLRRGALPEALQTCQDAIKVDPSSADAYRLMGQIQDALEKGSEAIESFRKATQLAPNSAESFVLLGAALSREKTVGSAQEVVDAYSKAIEVDPKHQAGRFELGRFLVKQGKLVEARKIWEGRTSDEDNTYPNFIELLERAENLQRAQKAIAEAPNDPATLVQYGNAIMAGDAWVVDRRQEKALPYFKEAIKLDPKNAEAHYALGRCYVELAHSLLTKDPKKLKAEANDELSVLRRLNPSLASKLQAYIAEGPGGLSGTPVNFDK